MDTGPQTTTFSQSWHSLRVPKPASTPTVCFTVRPPGPSPEPVPHRTVTSVHMSVVMTEWVSGLLLCRRRVATIGEGVEEGFFSVRCSKGTVPCALRGVLGRPEAHQPPSLQLVTKAFTVSLGSTPQRRGPRDPPSVYSSSQSFRQISGRFRSPQPSRPIQTIILTLCQW